MKIKKTQQRAGLCFSNHEDGIWPMNATKSICSLDNTAENPISPQPHTATLLHFHKTREGRTKSFSRISGKRLFLFFVFDSIVQFLWKSIHFLNSILHIFWLETIWGYFQLIKPSSWQHPLINYHDASA